MFLYWDVNVKRFFSKVDSAEDNGDPPKHVGLLILLLLHTNYCIRKYMKYNWEEFRRAIKVLENSRLNNVYVFQPNRTVYRRINLSVNKPVVRADAHILFMYTEFLLNTSAHTQTFSHNFIRMEMFDWAKICCIYKIKERYCRRLLSCVLLIKPHTSMQSLRTWHGLVPF
jgi:hypothetical protein